MQSAAARNASARTAAIADSRGAPYAITPGINSISAHQRPSSSRPTMIGMDSTVICSFDLSFNIIELETASALLPSRPVAAGAGACLEPLCPRSEEHTPELQ